ncbi:MAG TPA: tRNA pseudouridine(55) synthase TruB [Aggregatilineales bacterium]|nr:tRNA pseudouridine(55) synthase TruB [Anaerolineales bacterium]HRE49097.1 tRNA pseudouridine(55) synthase TruB [Aggregatilineales bacterium]
MAAIFGFFVVDKPQGMTSHDVVAGVRRGLNIRRVGHAGTLDPLATGILVVCVGGATRLSDYVMASIKTYQAAIRLGETTDTYDAEGTILARRPTDHLTTEAVTAALAAFQGEIDQIPPMYSAIKQGGKKLYELARKGETVERAARRVTLETRLIRCTLPLLELEITCTAGTYIRSLAHDLGEALGVGGHLAALRRTRSGEARDGVAWDVLKAAFASGTWGEFLTDEQKLLASIPALHLSAEAAAHILHGRTFPAEADESGEVCRAYGTKGEFLAIVRRVGALWTPEKVFGGADPPA